MTSYNVITNRNGIILWLCNHCKFIALCINTTKAKRKAHPPSPALVPQWWFELASNPRVNLLSYQMEDIVSFIDSSVLDSV